MPLLAGASAVRLGPVPESRHALSSTPLGTVPSSRAEPAPPTLRPPSIADGPTLWRLARDSGGLDLNSPYAYVLAGMHFASTSVLAELRDTPVGFVFAYLPPDDPDSVFVWQVAVAPSHRGTGLGRRMLHDVVRRGSARGARRLTATVTPSNDASRRLFTAVARDLGAGIDERPHLAAELLSPDSPAHAAGHEPEHLLAIGPLPTIRNQEGTP